MANQHHPSKQAVTYRVPRDLLARFRAEAAARGVTVTDLLIHAWERELPCAQAVDGSAANEKPRGG